MVNDPYKVLGVSPNASDEEIKRAYLELCRRYHPDSYQGNPLSDLAAEKFREVQESYEAINQMRAGGGYGGGYSGSYNDGGYSGGAGASQGEMEFYQKLSALESLRQFDQALGMLNSVTQRTDVWFYHSAICNFGVGNNMLALDHARQAQAMNPGNPAYASLVNQISSAGAGYQTYRYGNNNNSGDLCGGGAGDLCCKLWIADTCCECMGGDLCRCM